MADGRHLEKSKNVVLSLFMIFAVLDPSPLTLCINCSFLHLSQYRSCWVELGIKMHGITITSGQIILTKGRIAEGRFFMEYNVMSHQPVGSIAVGCNSRAVMPLLMIELSFLLSTPQQRLFNLPDPQNCPSGGSRPHLT